MTVLATDSAIGSDGVLLGHDPVSALDGVPLERVEAELCRQAGMLAAATCRWLDLVATFDAREGYASWGLSSTAQWLSWRCAVSPGTAREQVRVARALRRLPRLWAAFAAGQLSYSQVRAISRVAVRLPEIEADLVGLARECSAAQLEEVCRGIRRADDDKPPSRSRRYLRYYHDDAGYLVIQARLTPEDGAVVLAALQAAQTRLHDDTGDADTGDSDADTSTADAGDGVGEDVSAETRNDQADADLDDDEEDPDASSPVERSAVDALLAVAAGFLTGHPGAGSRTEPQVVLQVDLGVLTGATAGTCRLKEGPGIHPETARRLCCQAGIVAMLVQGPFEVLNLGRTTRVPNTAQRRALDRRDGGRCRFPGCRRRRGVEAHHIIFWSHGGPTDLDNLILLCKRHHVYVHEGGYRISVEGPATFAFFRPDGTRMPDPGLTGTGLVDNEEALRFLPYPASTIGPDTLPPRTSVDHRRPDYRHTIGCLLDIAYNRRATDTTAQEPGAA